MRGNLHIRRALAFGALMVAAQACAPRPAAAEEDGPSRKFTIIWGSKEDQEDAEARRKAGFIDCPAMVFDGGGAALRAPKDADAASVRYQVTIADKAVECKLDGDKILIKVGFAGAVVLGPAGQSGSYYGNLNIAVRSLVVDEIVASKSVRVGATIPAGASRGEYQIVTDPIVVRYGSRRASDDYEIVVGFAQGSAGAEEAAGAKGRRARRR